MFGTRITNRDFTSLAVFTVKTFLMPDTPLCLKTMGAFLFVDRYVVVQGIQIYDVFFFALKTKVQVTNVTVIFCVPRTQGAGLYITVRADAARIHAHDLIKGKKIRCTMLKKKHRYSINIHLFYGVSIGFYGVQ